MQDAMTLQKSSNSTETNCGPLSETISEGFLQWPNMVSSHLMMVADVIEVVSKH